LPTWDDPGQANAEYVHVVRQGRPDLDARPCFRSSFLRNIEVRPCLGLEHLQYHRHSFFVVFGILVRSHSPTTVPAGSQTYCQVLVGSDQKKTKYSPYKRCSHRLSKPRDFQQRLVDSHEMYYYFHHGESALPHESQR
jgi:hypothetical protein